MDELENIRNVLQSEREITLHLMEDVEQLLEVVISEIPLTNPKRQALEGYLRVLCGAIESLRERVKPASSVDPLLDQEPS